MSIREKLFIAYALVSVIVFTLSFSLLFYQVKKNLEDRIKVELTHSNRTITDLVETSATVSIKNHLRAIAEKNKEILYSIYRIYEQGKISLAEAKQQAANVLLIQTVGKTGYIYCIDSKGIAVVHPNKGVEGRDFSNRGFIQAQIAGKKGYLEYNWKNPEDETERPKALYMEYFEPWDWIISVSSYISEFSTLVTIDDFRDRIVGMTFGQSGYSYIFDTSGQIIIHPELSGNWIDIKDANGLPLIRKMIEKKKGYLTYHWKNKSDSLAREKFVAFDYIKSLDWIIASSSYTKEIFYPLFELQKLFLIILLFSIGVTAAVSLLISASITKPLSRLIHRLENTSVEAGSEPLEVNSNDEIGKLAASFNQFMERLDVYRKNLVDEISVRKKAQTQLLLFEKVFENTNEGISITDKNGNIETVNQAFTTITGYRAEEVIGQNPRILKSNRHDNDFYKNMWNNLIEKGEWAGEIWNRRKSGEAYPELLSVSAIRDDKGEINNYVAVFHDISEMKTKEQQIQHLAYHDPLTGLPNRTLLKDRLKKAVAQARRSGEMIQLLFIDLDNFKHVNDSVGHAMGDELLKKAAGRMLSVTRIGDTVSRLGGDEFIIMVTQINKESEIISMVERLGSVFSRPFSLGGHAFHVSCSIGISIYPNDGEDVDTLIKNADLAMYQSKHGGKDTYHLFENQMAQSVKERVQLEADLRKALKNNEFKVYFQPRIRSSDLEFVGMEALVRWKKRDGNFILPNRFIPLAEESGLIVPIGETVFKTAMADITALRKTSGRDLFLSVNVSTRQFDDPGFEKMIDKLLSDTGFPPDRLEIEVTESLLMKDTNHTKDRLNQFSKSGILTAIDDFGTGYSSLAYLRRLPISTLKIDKSFIADLPSDRDNMAIVETIILMAEKLNVSIVAEGVENHSQLEALSKLGQMEIQGYLFGKPMPIEQIESWIHSHASVQI